MYQVQSPLLPYAYPNFRLPTYNESQQQEQQQHQQQEVEEELSGYLSKDDEEVEEVRTASTVRSAVNLLLEVYRFLR